MRRGSRGLLEITGKVCPVGWWRDHGADTRYTAFWRRTKKSPHSQVSPRVKQKHTGQLPPEAELTKPSCGTVRVISVHRELSTCHSHSTPPWRKYPRFMKDSRASDREWKVGRHEHEAWSVSDCGLSREGLGEQQGDQLSEGSGLVSVWGASCASALGDSLLAGPEYGWSHLCVLRGDL